MADLILDETITAQLAPAPDHCERLANLALAAWGRPLTDEDASDPRFGDLCTQLSAYSRAWQGAVKADRQAMGDLDALREYRETIQAATGREWSDEAFLDALAPGMRQGAGVWNGLPALNPERVREALGLESSAQIPWPPQPMLRGGADSHIVTAQQIKSAALDLGDPDQDQAVGDATPMLSNITDLRGNVHGSREDHQAVAEYLKTYSRQSAAVKATWESLRQSLLLEHQGDGQAALRDLVTVGTAATGAVLDPITMECETIDGQRVALDIPPAEGVDADLADRLAASRRIQGAQRAGDLGSELSAITDLTVDAKAPPVEVRQRFEAAVSDAETADVQRRLDEAVAEFEASQRPERAAADPQAVREGRGLRVHGVDARPSEGGMRLHLDVRSMSPQQLAVAPTRAQRVERAAEAMQTQPIPPATARTAGLVSRIRTGFAAVGQAIDRAPERVAMAAKALYQSLTAVRRNVSPAPVQPVQRASAPVALEGAAAFEAFRGFLAKRDLDMDITPRGVQILDRRSKRVFQLRDVVPDDERRAYILGLAGVHPGEVEKSMRRALATEQQQRLSRGRGR